jgi:hypothetical protein
MRIAASDLSCSWVPDAPVDLHPGAKNVGSGRHDGAGAPGKSQDRSCVTPARAAKFTLMLVAYVTA